MGDALMRIGEIAAFFGVSVKAMRVYERMGILKPVKVDERTGYRYYSVDQVKQLDALLELRRLGFSLAEIRQLLASGMTSDEYTDVLVHKKAMWLDRISVAQSAIGNIDEIIDKLATSKPATKLHELTDDERAHLLSKMVCLENLHGRDLLSEALWV
jgi:DNA-binding transcriptional MerR regulator